jgi:hypothetical protein
MKPGKGLRLVNVAVKTIEDAQLQGVQVTVGKFTVSTGSIPIV